LLAKTQEEYSKVVSLIKNITISQQQDTQHSQDKSLKFLNIRIRLV
jgi:hypothetical protein